MPPHSNETNRGSSHRCRSSAQSREMHQSKRHRSNGWSNPKHQSKRAQSIAPALRNLPPGVLPEEMNPNSILTNPVVAEILHSFTPRQIQHSLDEFCLEIRSEIGIMRNIISDLVEFLKRYVKNEGLNPVARETPQCSAIELIRETARLEKEEHARDSQLQIQRLRLQKEALYYRVRLLKQEVEGLKTAKRQQGCENIASNIATALISSDDDASVDTFFSFDLSPEAVQRRRDENKVTVKHTTGTIKVSESVARDHRNCVPTCGYQMACFHSDWWWEGSQEAYEEFGHTFSMPESTIPIDVCISNHERGINTLATIAYLQFSELSGFDKDCYGQYINRTLSRVQQWAAGIYEIAQEFTAPGNHCNNPAESIIIVDAVNGLHDKKWAETADKDLLKTLDKLFLLKLKTMRKGNTKSNIQVTGK